MIVKPCSLNTFIAIRMVPDINFIAIQMVPDINFIAISRVADIDFIAIIHVTTLRLHYNTVLHVYITRTSL